MILQRRDAIAEDQLKAGYFSRLDTFICAQAVGKAMIKSTPVPVNKGYSSKGWGPFTGTGLLARNYAGAGTAPALTLHSSWPTMDSKTGPLVDAPSHDHSSAHTGLPVACWGGERWRWTGVIMLDSCNAATWAWYQVAACKSRDQRSSSSGGWRGGGGRYRQYHPRER
jgi:hypothetical protein